MPLDVVIKYIDNTQETIYIPQYLMFGEKPNENSAIKRTTLNPWKWTNPTYTFEIRHKFADIKEIEIDPSQRIADINRKNNRIEFSNK